MPTNQRQQNPNQNQQQDQNQKRDAQQGGRDDMRKTAGREQDQDRGGKNAPQRSDDGTSNR